MTDEIVKQPQEWRGRSFHPDPYAAAAEITALRAEVERLGRDLALADDAAREWRQHCLAAEAERDRLRVDLKRAANRLQWCAGLLPSNSSRDQASVWAEEALAALADLKPDAKG